MHIFLNYVITLAVYCCIVEWVVVIIICGKSKPPKMIYACNGETSEEDTGMSTKIEYSRAGNRTPAAAVRAPNPSH